MIITKKKKKKKKMYCYRRSRITRTEYLGFSSVGVNPCLSVAYFEARLFFFSAAARFCNDFAQRSNVG